MWNPPSSRLFPNDTDGASQAPRHPAKRDPAVAAALTPPWALEPGCDPQDEVLDVTLSLRKAHPAVEQGPPQQQQQQQQQQQLPLNHRGRAAEVTFTAPSQSASAPSSGAAAAASAPRGQGGSRRVANGLPHDEAKGKNTAAHITTTASPRAARQPPPPQQQQQQPQPLPRGQQQQQQQQLQQQLQSLHQRGRPPHVRPRRRSPVSPKSRPVWQGVGPQVPLPDSTTEEEDKEGEGRAAESSHLRSRKHTAATADGAGSCVSGARGSRGQQHSAGRTLSRGSSASRTTADAKPASDDLRSRLGVGGGSVSNGTRPGSIVEAFYSDVDTHGALDGSAWDADPDLGWAPERSASLGTAAVPRHYTQDQLAGYRTESLDLGASDWSLRSNNKQAGTSGTSTALRHGRRLAVRPPSPSVSTPPPPCPSAKPSVLSQQQQQQPRAAAHRAPSPASLLHPSKSLSHQTQLEGGSTNISTGDPAPPRVRRPSTCSSGGSTNEPCAPHGPGLSVMSGRMVMMSGAAGAGADGTSAGGSRPPHEAEEEAASLRAEVAALKQLLGVWQHAGSQAAHLPRQQEAAVLQRYRTQLWQQQRQVALMGAELKARARVAAEADAMLHEVCGQLDGLVEATDAARGDAQVVTALTADHALALGRWAKKMQHRLRSERARSSKALTRAGLQLQSKESCAAAATAKDEEAAAGLAPTWEVPFIPAGGNRFLAAMTAAAAVAPQGGSRASPPGTAATPAAASVTGSVVGAAPGSTTSTAPSRPSGAKAPSTSSSLAGAAAGAAVGAARLTIARLASGLASLGGTLAWGKPAPQAHAAAPSGNAAWGASGAGAAAAAAMPGSASPPRDAAAPAPAASSSSTVAGLLSQGGGGRGLALCALIARPELCAGLEGSLSGLAPKLGSVSVMLRTLVLPAMPWLCLEATERVQVEIAECCSAAAAAARSLWELSALMPAGAAAATAGTAAQGGSDLGQRGAEVSSGRDSWLWASVAACEEGAKPVGSGGPADMLGIDVDGLLAAALPLLSERASAGGKPKRHQQQQGGGECLGRPASTGTAFQQLQECVGIPLQAALHAAFKRQALLESELHFCCRASALQGEHVKHLISTTEAELHLARQHRAQQVAEVRGSMSGSPRTLHGGTPPLAPVPSADLPNCSTAGPGIQQAGSNSCSQDGERANPPPSSPRSLSAATGDRPPGVAPSAGGHLGHQPQVAHDAASALQELLVALDVFERRQSELELAALVALFQSTRAALAPAPHLLMRISHPDSFLQQQQQQQQPCGQVDVGSTFGRATAQLQASRQLTRRNHSNENMSDPHGCAGAQDGHIIMPWDVDNGSGQQVQAQVEEGANMAMDPGQGIVKKTRRNAGGGNRRTYGGPTLQQPAWES